MRSFYWRVCEVLPPPRLRVVFVEARLLLKKQGSQSSLEFYYLYCMTMIDKYMTIIYPPLKILSNLLKEKNLNPEFKNCFLNIQMIDFAKGISIHCVKKSHRRLLKYQISWAELVTPWNFFLWQNNHAQNLTFAPKDFFSRKS